MLRLLLGLAAAFAFTGAAAAKPLVVLLADERGTEITDLITPYAILAESGAVEVKVVSVNLRPARLIPGMAWVAPQMTLSQLAAARPGGPDVIIVPAMMIEDDPARSAWLREQAAKGVRIMAICNGGLVLASSGLLDGRQATVHWFSRSKAAKKFPKVKWRYDQRWVTDGQLTSTAGISASEPASLNLLRSLAGDAVMRQTAARMGLTAPNQRHDGQDYRLTARGARLVVENRLAFWGHEKVAVPLTAGFDELAFATTLDAWSRTYRSAAWATGASATVSRHGLTIYRSSTPPARFDRTARLPAANPVGANFAAIGAAYGDPTARFVALQFEHPYGAISAW